MDIDELSRRTGLDTRRLRYVIEYNVLPPVDALDSIRPGRGHGREFNDFTGFCIALAAFMLEMGLKRSLVQRVMETALEYHKPDLGTGLVMFPALQHVYAFAKKATLEIGDGCNVRIDSQPSYLPAGENTVQMMSLPWTQMSTHAQIGDCYEPLVRVAVRLDLLAKMVRV